MEIRIGKVTHYYNQISVAVLELIDELKIGDTVVFLGHTTDVTQEVTRWRLSIIKSCQVVQGWKLL